MNCVESNEGRIANASTLYMITTEPLFLQLA
jgi:hypothetical protein